VDLPDPIAKAEVLLSYGRKVEALELLRAAASAHPERADIQRRLESLTAHREDPPKPIWALLPHFVVAWAIWVLSLLCLAGAFALTYIGVLGPSLGHILGPGELPISGILAIIGLAVAAALVGIYLAIILFLNVLFGYLNLLPLDLRRQVDARLPSAIAVRRMEPMYSRVRSRVFKTGDDI